mmetsp:Transcript_9497/g.17626  ORF Transcript_9497/g.17626 Transcript_9497/m.17626 type:complete len:80 (+) Transcript_9497:968-1207(+)
MLARGTIPEVISYRSQRPSHLNQVQIVRVMKLVTVPAQKGVAKGELRELAVTEVPMLMLVSLSDLAWAVMLRLNRATTC